MRPVRRIEPVDLLRIGDTTLLLYETRLVRLSPLGGAIYEMAVVCIDVDDLTRDLVKVFGPPPDSTPGEATWAAVGDLAEVGVLDWEREPPIACDERKTFP